MSALGLEDEEVKYLETTVLRLSQLCNNIQSFKADVLRSDPIPPAYVVSTPLLIVLHCSHLPRFNVADPMTQ